MEWISVNDDLPKGPGDIVIAKRENGDEMKVYFHKDKMFPLARYWKDHKLSYWQRFDNTQWIYGVMHWRSLRKEDKG